MAAISILSPLTHKLLQHKLDDCFLSSHWQSDASISLEVIYSYRSETPMWGV